MDQTCGVAVSRRIAAPASAIFTVLTDPSTHRELDGSGMLRVSPPGPAIRAVGDVFVTRMFFERLGHYSMDNRVVEYEQDRLVAWEPRAGEGHPGRGEPAEGHRWRYRLEPEGPLATVVTETYDCSRASSFVRTSTEDGRQWEQAMAATLVRLEAIVTPGRGHAPRG